MYGILKLSLRGGTLTAIKQIRIDRLSAANYDLILWLDEPGVGNGLSIKELQAVTIDLDGAPRMGLD